MKKLLLLSIFVGIQGALIAQTQQKVNKVKLTKVVELQQLSLAKQKQIDAQKMQKIKNEEPKKVETGFSKAVTQQNIQAKKED
jgi:hypothetical protein